ncbi:4'-phosphopantetheinyl transferase superfamily protein [Chryseobacterium taklimakanense]|uniref:4'-phosphopantetheinyl transferase family protein n=1 Tax=Chryseobacterium taklimakanense TaxID=536441 RepID=UPI000F5FA1AD|nr:4'-phosphopantetheinyl transferase superfamily protein [Chryseobacterium taklimakanense]AZI23109.1 4'-phosphopantetheinyl transferase superfamily protein [Chryseobacterium taklimakanense]
MPFYQDFTDENATILFWKYNEHDQFNQWELIQPEDFEKVQNYHPKKMAEYLMIRKLLRMAKPDHKILYQSIGKPYLYPKDDFISITHSYPFAALAISKKRVGIDIERIMPKILNIKSKFLHESETVWTKNADEVKFLTVIWVIKEALYKLHPSKYWSLKKHYEVEPFELNDLNEIKCRVFDENFEDRYIAKVIKIEDFYFAIIEENHKINYKIPQNNIF